MTMTVYATKIKSDIDFPLYWVHDQNVYLYSNREFDGNEVGQPWCYEVQDAVTFYWLGGERTIYYKLDVKGDINLLSFWFIHLLLPFYMTLENMYDFLHAGAVEIDIKQGHPLISDDKVPTFIQDGKFMAVGSHPYYRPYRKFEELGYRVEKFTETFKPIHTFYELEGVECDVKITIEEIKGSAKFDVLLPNCLYMFSWLKPERLKYLSKMLNDVRVFHVEVPWNMERLGEVYNVICEHSKGIK